MTSSIDFPSMSSRRARKIFVISFCAFSSRRKRLSKCASFPRSSVTRWSEKFGSSLLSQ
ncbi:Uncharacterised protein [Mycobacteroides abscessus]|nr:Uncharacterised protein [Mycobacteroides abscessus]